MSIQTYAVLDNLPAPLTSGSTIQSFTDVLGDVWVAKNGVNGGVWRRARDVLHARVYRTTAFTSGAATGSPFNMDGIDFDDYGLCTGPNFTVPIVGWYQFKLQVALGATAAGQYVDARFLYTNSHGSSFSLNRSYSPSAVGTVALDTETLRIDTPGSTVAFETVTQVAMVMTVGAWPGFWTWASVDFMGSY